MEIRILIDWISVTNHNKLQNGFRYVHPTCQIESEWSKHSGNVNGYDIVGKHISGTLKMRSSKQPLMGTHIIHSGGALEFMFDRYLAYPEDVLGFYHRNGGKMSRIDIAIDVFNSGLKLEPLEDDFNSGRAETQARTGALRKNLPRGTGETLYIGSTKARKKLLRIYDKGAEQGTNLDWYRIEYEIHGKPAQQASAIITDTQDFNLAVKSIIRGYCDFKTSDVWLEIFDGVHKQKLRGQSESIGNTQKWLLDIVTPSLAREVALDDRFRDKFESRLEVEYHRFLKNQEELKF